MKSKNDYILEHSNTKIKETKPTSIFDKPMEDKFMMPKLIELKGNKMEQSRKSVLSNAGKDVAFSQNMHIFSKSKLHGSQQVLSQISPQSKNSMFSGNSLTSKLE